MPEEGAVVVPDFVGMPVHIAIEEAAERRILLTAADFDGPSLHAQTWPGLYWVTAQDLPPGSVVGKWARIVVTYVVDGGTRSGVASPSPDPLPSLRQYADTEDDGSRE